MRLISIDFLCVLFLSAVVVVALDNQTTTPTNNKSKRINMYVNYTKIQIETTNNKQQYKLLKR